VRTGYTTGATAAAAAKVATLALLGGGRRSEIAISLPTGEDARFPLAEWAWTGEEARCGILKDGGDDPDVTHGALVRATVRRIPTPGLWVRGGEGVGKVTRPGLPVPVGSPAINPTPMRMIRNAANAALSEMGFGEPGGLEVTLSIPEGRRLAARTLNARLGILGGLSILGTTGIVIPYSVDAYKLSIRLALEMAQGVGLEVVVLSTGRSSEKLAQVLLPPLPVQAFVVAGDHLGYALREAGRLGFRRAILAGFPGKLGKLALGYQDTHERRGRLDLEALAALLPGNAKETWREGFAAAPSARSALSLLPGEARRALGQEIARRMVIQGMTLAGCGMEIGGLVLSHDGQVVGLSPSWLEEIIGR